MAKKNLIYIVISVIALAMLITPSAIMAKECAVGVNRCAVLKNRDTDKYNRCMELVCEDEVFSEISPKLKKEHPKDESTENINSKKEIVTEAAKNVTCDEGLRKCNPIRNDYEPYWECMKDTCANPEGKNPSCKKGHDTCSPRLSEYRLCMNLVCKTRVGTFEECDKGKKSCGETLRQYWNCVTSMCLGDVSHYIKSRKVYEQTIEAGDKEGEEKVVIRQVDVEPIKGVHPRFRYPPVGVDPVAWRSRINVKTQMTASPQSIFTCGKHASLSCSGLSMQSCKCSDGFPPRFKQKQKPRIPWGLNPIYGNSAFQHPGLYPKKIKK